MHHRTSCYLLFAARKKAMPGTQRIPTRDNIARSRSGSIRSVSGHRIVDDLHATSRRVCHVAHGNSGRSADARVVPERSGQKSARLPSLATMCYLKVLMGLKIVLDHGGA